MEHITRGVNKALGNCGPGNILRELPKRTDRKQVETLKTEKTHLAAQVAAMTRELAQKSEEIRKYQAKQAVVLSQVRKLVGHPGEVVNKAHLYDQLMESADPEIPGEASRRSEPGPRVGGSSGRGRQQGAPLRPTDGVSRSGNTRRSKPSF